MVRARSAPNRAANFPTVYLLAAGGTRLFYLAVVIVYAVKMDRLEAAMFVDGDPEGTRAGKEER